ncbi:MAG: hypothetical protein A2427_04910 [Candidatus Nealsonbacteria bacterium RIFOXYC1_FULL_40_7]|uniref:Uncharacterized protein n=1 Tax=Candidatus Nealsonbacteria bacterium RIFOXYC1_FULL_40_7 TaxID=1801678 RepID=A0A1G2EQ29_9BACT|nr:MAG: hypothetical protein A2427_04910 [Candidatus Nealsonbacteria bacterium RIFOXYC1_FULL_40_7]OGZ29630.1 MAG: hypothetical protein A2562_03925 [Candidatus Nealsonbacteria bacterium RIFOXYD1_FULL_39_11]
MQERIIDPPNEENLITKINYSGRLKGLFGMVMFGIPALALRTFEQNPSVRQSLPIFMRGKLFDVMAAPWHASLSKVFFGDLYLMNLASAMISPSITEISQGLGLIDGTFSVGDFAAYAIGTICWAAFENTAKTIHDSGLSLPIYRALGIQHRKFDR